MEKRDAILVLLVLSGGGYGMWRNWGAIAAKLQLGDLDPGRLRAVQLAKEANSLASSYPNWQYLQTRKQNTEITMTADAWKAEYVTGEEYHVEVRWTEDGEPVIANFRVDTATRTTKFAGFGNQPAAPR